MDHLSISSAVRIEGAESASRAATLLIQRLARDPETLRYAIENGLQEFARVARAELRGLALSSADMERVYQMLRRHLTMSPTAPEASTPPKAGSAGRSTL
jgi:hypothetical protein